jgi:hypothetical protein
LSNVPETGARFPLDTSRTKEEEFVGENSRNKIFGFQVEICKYDSAHNGDIVCIALEEAASILKERRLP